MRVVLTCPKYAARRPGILAELERVGLRADELENPYVAGLEGLERAHRAAWTRFIASGAETLLVVEDDVRFLADTARLARIVDSLPPGFDEARFCWGGARGDAKAARGQTWAPVGRNRGTCYMTACYALSRRAACAYLRLSTAMADGRVEFCGIDLRMGTHPPEYVTLVSVPPAALVSGSDGVSGRSARAALLDDAGQFGVRESDYA